MFTLFNVLMVVTPDVSRTNSTVLIQLCFSTVRVGMGCLVCYIVAALLPMMSRLALTVSSSTMKDNKRILWAVTFLRWPQLYDTEAGLILHVSFF
jgi:hypothetical protein